MSIPNQTNILEDWEKKVVEQAADVIRKKARDYHKISNLEKYYELSQIATGLEKIAGVNQP